MSITDYSTLQAQIAAFANRNDLTSQIPVFIQLAEQRMNFGTGEPPFVSDPLRTRSMENNSEALLDAQRVELPPDFLERRRFYIVLTDDSAKELSYLPPDQFWSRREASLTGTPQFFTIEGCQLVLAPSPDMTYTGHLLYFGKIEALADDNTSNWILENAPGIYLDGALMELWVYLRDPMMAESAHARFVGRINALNNSEKQAWHGGTPWVGRSDLCNP